MPVRIGDDHLRIKIDMFQQTRRFDDVTQLRLAPGATYLVVAQCSRQRARLTVEPRLLFPQTLELLAERTHFTLAPLFDLGNLLLKGVKILLHRSQSGEHLALLPQLPLAFGLPTFRFRGGLFTLTFDSRLLGALRLRQLGFEICQLLIQSFGLRAVLCHGCGQIADPSPTVLDLSLRLVQVGGTRIPRHVLPSGSPRKKARSRSKHGHDYHQHHYKHRIVEHMF